MSKAVTIQSSGAVELASQASELVNVEVSYKVGNITEAKKWDSDFVVGVAQSIMKISDQISKGIEHDKQLMLGEVFNTASLSAKSGNKKLKIKDIQKALGVAPTTWSQWVLYYVTNVDFKNILSLDEPDVRLLPNSSQSNELRGTDSEDRLQNWKQITTLHGDSPKVLDIREFNKLAKEINAKKPWKVTADEIKVVKAKAHVAEDEDTTPTVEEPKKEKGWEKKERLKKEYEEKTGISYSDLEDELDEMHFDSKLPANIVDSLATMNQTEWKSMYKKGSKAFHPDLGGTASEMVVWKEFALLAEACFENIAYNIKEAELTALGKEIGL